VVAGALAAPAAAKKLAAARKLTAANWDAPEQRLVVREAVMGPLGGAGFAGASPLSAAAESSALAAIAAREGVAPVAFDPGLPLTVVRFDALLVDQLGLGEVAEHVQQVARGAGLNPPSYFGSEVVARYLNLRYTHPPGEQTLALYPWNSITRSEAAHSFAVVLGLVGDDAAGDGAASSTPASGTSPSQSSGVAESTPPASGAPLPQSSGAAESTPPASGAPLPQSSGAAESTPPASGAPLPQPGSWALTAARETLMSFELPHYSAAQREVLDIAVSKIGMPYIWGGTTDNTADGLEHGGYDCSGFAWRVYKLSGLPWGRQILGRTAAEQAGEIPKRRRIHLQDVAPGDLLFFGSAHFESNATNANVIHEAIAMSSQWAINSSAQGVYVLPLTSGWLAESFTWARRVL
jgi:cell wall-associated NlpC family hydrolase